MNFGSFKLALFFLKLGKKIPTCHVGFFSVVVQIKFVKTAKMKPFRSINRSEHLANMQATITNGLPMSQCQV